MRSLARETIFGTALAVVISALSAGGAGATHHGTPGSGNNNVYISAPNALGTQVFLLLDNHNPPTINANSLVFKGTNNQITLTNAINCYTNPANQPIANIWYFYLGKGQTAQLTNYATTAVNIAVWVPVDSSSTGQMPSPITCWFPNTCFSYPATLGAPSTAVPAGATFAEINLSNSIFDTVDISEVNGVNAAWEIDLPTPWFNKSYQNQTGQIPVAHIHNNPGSSPNFYGDYGNPGVYPFGCTSCASRYMNPTINPPTPPGSQRSGCLASEFMPPVTYPTMDVGCDNAINYYPNNVTNVVTGIPSTANGLYTSYESAPPGRHKLPIDPYAPGGKLVTIPSTTALGYGICNIVRGAAASGGSINIKLQTYPFGQIQP